MDPEPLGDNTVAASNDDDQKDGSNSDTGYETLKELKVSGRWSDIEAPSGFGEEDLNEGFEGRTYTAPSISPSYSPYRTPSPKTISPIEAFHDKKYDAPVLFVKRTYGATVEVLKIAIMKVFDESEVKDVKVVDLYISTGEGRDHAYLLLNSDTASQLLLDGTLTVIIQVDRGNDRLEEVSLWIDYADHLVPNEEQDPYMLYVWQLPKDRPVQQVENELVHKILNLAPILEIEMEGDQRGMCMGWAQVTFKYERDTQKCVYMLNYNRFMNVEIRAAFYQLNRPPRKPIAAPVPRKSPGPARGQSQRKSPNHLSSSPPRPSDRSRRTSGNEKPTKPTRQHSAPGTSKAPVVREKTPSGSSEKRRGPGEKAPGKKAAAEKTVPPKPAGKNIGWEVIGREGRTK